MGVLSSFIGRVGIVAVLAFHLAPIWRELDAWGGTFDWGYFFMLTEVSRKTVVEFGQFPLWNPYYCGGAVHLANPQTYFLSPTFLFVLAFGSAIGLKLMVTAAMVIAWDGVRRWCLHLGASPLSANIAGLGFAVCGALAQHLGGGHVGWVGFAAVPYVLVLFHLALDGRSWAIPVGAIILAFILGHWGVYPYPYAVMALCVYGLSVAVFEKKVAIGLRSLASMIALSVGLAAIRLLPLVEFIRRYPREVDDWDRLAVSDLWEMYFVRHTARHWGHQYVWPEYGNYFGFVGMGLMLAGLSIIVLRRRRLAPIAIAAGVFLLFSFGNVPYLPWSWLRSAPVFESLRVPSRFTIFVGMFGCVAIACALDALRERVALTFAKPVAGLAITCVVGAIYLIDASSFNRLQFEQSFRLPPPTHAPSRDFHNVSGNPNMMFAYPRANRGSVACFEESPVPRSDALTIMEPPERQELLVDPSAGTVTRRSWSPNRIVLDVALTQTTTLTVNQNWGPGWRAASTPVFSHDGLIAVSVGPQDTVVDLFYRPPYFWLGACLSALSLIAALGFAWRPRPQRRRELSGSHRWFSRAEDTLLGHEER